MIHVTDEHPFYVQGRGWTEAAALRAGFEVVTADGARYTIIANTDDVRSSAVKVYNLEVADGHTYFVADGNGADTFVWAHNTCITINAVAGRARETRALTRLSARFGTSNVLSQRYLLDAQGDVLRFAGRARRIDFVVLKGGKAQRVYEVTSKLADKTKQLIREANIHAMGSVFVRDPASGMLVDVSGLISKVMRIK